MTERRKRLRRPSRDDYWEFPQSRRIPPLWTPPPQLRMAGEREGLNWLYVLYAVGWGTALGFMVAALITVVLRLL